MYSKEVIDFIFPALPYPEFVISFQNKHWIQFGLALCFALRQKLMLSIEKAVAIELRTQSLQSDLTHVALPSGVSWPCIVRDVSPEPLLIWMDPARWSRCAYP